MSELLNRAMQRIAREDFDKAEKAMVAEQREGLDRIYAQAKAMMLEAEKICRTPYSGDAGDETE